VQHGECGSRCRILFLLGPRAFGGFHNSDILSRPVPSPPDAAGSSLEPAPGITLNDGCVWRKWLTS
jgi:hypothetical protein